MQNTQLLCQTLGDTLAQKLQADNIDQPLIIGIHTGGVWVAEKIREQLKLEEPTGTVDISFYRDDFSQRGLHPHVKGSNLPWDIENRHLILIDDVIKSGRTIRAAMNELFDFGRPATITLACLVDVGARELPIQPDAYAIKQTLKDDEYVELTGPEPLILQTYSRAKKETA